MTDKDRSSDNASGPDWEMLARFVAGECSPEERRAMERVLEADPARAEMLHALGVAVRAPDAAPPAALEVEAALAKVRAQRGDTRTGPSTRRASIVSLDAYRSRWRDARLAAAAAVIVVAGVGLIWRTALSPRGDRMPAGTQTHYATAIGRLDSLQLPDGSHVLLGPGSELDISPDFGTLSRDVTLKGEANFAVVHDATHPFLVHTAWATFRDVGTVFVVHSDDVEGARVAVREGAVAVEVHPGSPPQTLAAGDRALVAPQGTIRVERSVKLEDDLAWMSGRLVFRDAPMTQVTADLRRWYGIELRVDSALARARISTTFDRTSTPPDVGRVIAATVGGGLREEGGAFHIIALPRPTPR